MIQIIKVNKDKVITIGTNLELILSASLAIGALELAASSTSFTIFAIVEFLEVVVALK